MSRFEPTEEEMRQSVVWANQRAERLAGRIGRARHALRRGESSTSVLAILDDASQPEQTYADVAEGDQNAPSGDSTMTSTAPNESS